MKLSSIFYSILCLTIISFPYDLIAQKNYLSKNAHDLKNKGFQFPQQEVKLIGFGAYHGSADTEKTELALIASLENLRYYLPETDFSTAHFFNQYLETGDSILLQELVLEYGIRVPQEKTIEYYNKWKSLLKTNQALSQEKKLQVIGIDKIASFKYPIKHIVELLSLEEKTIPSLSNLIALSENDTVNYSSYIDGYCKNTLMDFIDDYKSNKNQLNLSARDTDIIEHIIINIEYVIEKENREIVLFKNYKEMNVLYDLKNNKHFLRYGFGHILKEREDTSPTLFSLLIENGIYTKKEVVTIIGYLTKSKVLWGTIKDENGKYDGYVSLGGFGIGDYWKEYFKGIKQLKKNKISDITLFRLNQEKSPYREKGGKLIQVKLFLKKSNGKSVRKRSTTDFIDYAILISHSKAALPIEILLENITCK